MNFDVGRHQMTEIEHFLEFAEGNSLELTHLVAYSKANNISVPSNSGNSAIKMFLR